MINKITTYWILRQNVLFSYPINIKLKNVQSFALSFTCAL